MATRPLKLAELAVMHRRVLRASDLQKDSRLDKPRTPKLLNGLLFLFIVTLVLIGIQLFPPVNKQGFRPTLSLILAAILLTVALVKVFRSR